jgi:hypothetical protein
LEHPTKALGEPVSKLMKIKYLALGLLAVGGLVFSGCATDTATTTTQTQTDPSKSVHTQEELKKSGETNPAAALEKTEPSMTVSGPR